MALLVGMTAALVLAAFEIGIRTGGLTRLFSTTPRLAPSPRAVFAYIAHPQRYGGRGRAHPGHT